MTLLSAGRPRFHITFRWWLGHADARQVSDLPESWQSRAVDDRQRAEVEDPDKVVRSRQV